MSSSTTNATEMSGEDDGYGDFLDSIRARFYAIVEKPIASLFTTTATGLWATFLEGIPLERRQHYTCRSCEKFVDRFGGLVTISAGGDATLAMWDPATAPPFFHESIRALQQAVQKAKVNGVFLNEEKTWGLPFNRSKATPSGWHHMAVKPIEAALFKPTATRNAGQAMAELLEEHAMLHRGLVEYPIEIVREAHKLLTSGQLYRSEKCIGVAKWLLDLHEALHAARPGESRRNVVWLAVAKAPAGFCHVRTTMISTLLDDIVTGMEFADIKRRFDEKMRPSVYGRAVAAPSAGNIAQAEKIIADMKATGSLGRRFARLEDIALERFEWLPAKAFSMASTKTGGVFGHLVPKASKVPSSPALVVPAQTMTWAKFQRSVLPDAVNIEAQIPAASDRMMALVTAVQSDAPPILQWDDEKARNQMSWYYATGGIDAEIKRRVLEAGGRYEDCDIRISLIWENTNDLDLHVITPNGSHIYYASRRDGWGGELDVDRNVNGETKTPIENTRWPKHTARPGRYRVYVQNFRFHEHSHQATPFRVEVEVGGEVYRFNGQTLPYHTQDSSDVEVCTFDYVPGQKLNVPPVGLRNQRDNTTWSVTPTQWIKVTGIVNSPNLWSETPMSQHGQHMFFLLDGCRDGDAGLGRGFFVETLRGEFRPIRSTLEAYAGSATIDGADEATACGIGMSYSSPWDLTLRVTLKDGSVNSYKIDRWD